MLCSDRIFLNRGPYPIKEPKKGLAGDDGPKAKTVPQIIRRIVLISNPLEVLGPGYVLSKYFLTDAFMLSCFLVSGKQQEIISSAQGRLKN